MLPVDSQLLGLAKDDLDVKRRLLDQMDKMDTQYGNNMARLSANMNRRTDSIADGFSLLRGLLLQQQPMFHSLQQPVYPPLQMMYPQQQLMYKGSNNQCYCPLPLRTILYHQLHSRKMALILFIPVPSEWSY